MNEVRLNIIRIYRFEITHYGGAVDIRGRKLKAEGTTLTCAGVIPREKIVPLITETVMFSAVLNAV